MSNENQETIADIVREMRTLGRLDEKSTDKIPRTLQALGLRTYADRIEAAEKRERDETHEKSSQVGNSAKMREALSRILGIADHLQTRFTIPKLVSEEISELKQIAESALSSPPRNCDLFATSKEAGEAFISQACENPCGNCTVSDECHNPLVHECGIKWLFAEAKGVTDGSK